MLWRLTLLLNLPVCISCLLRGEKHSRLCPFGEELKVVVSPVIDDLGDRGKDPLLRHRYILFFPVYDHTEAGISPSWSSTEYYFTPLLVRRNFAQSCGEGRRWITVGSKLTGFCLSWNLRVPLT